MPAVAVTEHGNMFSAITFHDHARERGVKPILGCEVYVAPGSRHDRGGPVSENYNHLVLLAETPARLAQPDQAGVGGLHRGVLPQAAHRQGTAGEARGRASSASAAASRARSRRPSPPIRPHAPRPSAATFRDILGKDNFFLELQWHGIDDQRVVNRGLAPIARDLGLPLVATNDVHYLRHGDHVPHDVLLCIGTGQIGQRRRRGCAITATSST